MADFCFKVGPNNDVDLYRYLNSVVSWNDFAYSLVNTLIKEGGLTENQYNAAVRMFNKHKAKLEAQANAPTINLTGFHDLFKRAHDSGLTKPKLFIGTLMFSEAPAHGNNADHIYVKDSGDYSGKITPQGKFIPFRAREDLQDELLEIAKDPTKAMLDHGHQSGRCSCCGRELTDPDSVDAGIGPVCAKKWGIVTSLIAA